MSSQTYIDTMRAEAKNQEILNHQAAIRECERRIVVAKAKIMLLESKQVICRRFAHDGTSERIFTDIKIRKNQIYILVSHGGFHAEWMIISHNATFRFADEVQS